MLNFKENDEPSWVIEHAQAQKRDAVIEQKSELEARLRKVRAKALRQKKNYENGESKTKRTVCCSRLELNVSH